MHRNESGTPAMILALAGALMATGPPTCRAVQPADPGLGQAHTVTIQDMRYSPRTITVHRGDRITWINKDLVPHTVTATDGKFDSHLIAAGGSWTYVTRDSGAYDYKCILHVAMKGRVVVR